MATLEGHTLARSIILALERMAFVLTEELDPEEITDALPLHMKIAIRGMDKPIELLVSTSSGFLTEFTANLLGIADCDEQIGVYSHPALSELTNVVAEEVYHLLGGADADPQLSKPLSCDEPNYIDGGHAAETTVVAYLGSEGGCLRFCLTPLEMADADA